MKTLSAKLCAAHAGRWLSALGAVVGDGLYPRVCPGCGVKSDRCDRYLCNACWSRIDFLDSCVCDICGNPATGSPAAAFVCDHCRRKKPAFDRARSAVRFSGVCRTMLHSFKYGNALWLTADIADLMLGALQTGFEWARIDAVIPVPLYRTRLRERTYNQALVLAKSLARRIDRRVDGESLRRVRATATQTHYNSRQRSENIAGAFSVVRPQWIAGRTLLLVDDVMTTGATLGECAKELKKNGAATVLALSAARR